MSLSKYRYRSILRKRISQIMECNTSLISMGLGLMFRLSGFTFIAYQIFSSFSAALFCILLTLSTMLLVTLHVCIGLNGSVKSDWTKTAAIFSKAVADFGMVMALVYYLIEYNTNSMSFQNQNYL